jgi:hypothetical protein
MCWPESDSLTLAMSLTSPKLAGVAGRGAAVAPVTGFGPRFQRPLRFEERGGVGVGLVGGWPGWGVSEFIRKKEEKRPNLAAKKAIQHWLALAVRQCPPFC